MDTTGQGTIGNPFGWPEGYMPHPYMGEFKCDRCGCTKFVSHPQSAPADRNRPWTFEYECKRCGHMMGLTIEPGREGER